MRPFLLLGDITGSLAILGLVVLVFGGLALFGGIQLQRTSTTAGKGIGYVAMMFGGLVVLISLAFLSAVWHAQPSHTAQRQIEEAEAARQDTSWKAQARQSQQELKRFEQSFDQQVHELSDSSWRHGVQQDSTARAPDEKAFMQLEW